MRGLQRQRAMALADTCATQVAANVGSLVCTVTYAGEAPGSTSGVQQINVQRPLVASPLVISLLHRRLNCDRFTQHPGSSLDVARHGRSMAPLTTPL
jgi:hypothetical protein